MPSWLQGEVLDIRTTVVDWMKLQPGKDAKPIPRRSANIAAQLKALGLQAFRGREHCGIDVSTANYENILNF
jgi:3'-5' exoribonuclease 1